MSAAARKRLPKNVDPRTGRIRRRAILYPKGMRARLFIGDKEVGELTGFDYRHIEPDEKWEITDAGNGQSFMLELGQERKDDTL